MSAKVFLHRFADGFDVLQTNRFGHTKENVLKTEKLQSVQKQRVQHVHRMVRVLAVAVIANLISWINL